MNTSADTWSKPHFSFSIFSLSSSEPLLACFYLSFFYILLNEDKVVFVKTNPVVVADTGSKPHFSFFSSFSPSLLFLPVMACYVPLFSQIAPWR